MFEHIRHQREHRPPVARRTRRGAWLSHRIPISEQRLIELQGNGGRLVERYFFESEHADANTLRTWLSMWSLSESHCRGVPHLNRIEIPALVLQSTADTRVFPSDAKAIYDALGANDKLLEMVPGDHYLETPENARDDAADRLAAWLSEHDVIGQ